jgi:ubiquinone/menaquinone biosynthesis C-methylase UbiE
VALQPKLAYNKRMEYARNWLIKSYALACERLYDELAWIYDGVSWLVSVGRWAVWRRSAFGYLPVQDRLRVLEIGFGTGELLLELAQRNIAVLGLELSPAMHQVARDKLRSRGVSAPLLRARAQAIPLASAQFDAILATFPAPYIVDPATLSECARTLRAEGRLVIVGLWVAVKPAALARILPLFYGAPAPGVWEAIAQRMAAAGLCAELHRYIDGPFEVGVIVARNRGVDAKGQAT